MTLYLAAKSALAAAIFDSSSRDFARRSGQGRPSRRARRPPAAQAIAGRAGSSAAAADQADADRIGPRNPNAVRECEGGTGGRGGLNERAPRNGFGHGNPLSFGPTGGNSVGDRHRSGNRILTPNGSNCRDSGVTDDPESCERAIREPPAALRELRIAFVPRIGLDGPCRRADTVALVSKRPTACDAGAVSGRDPFRRVAEKIKQAERIRLALAYCMRPCR